jgi:uncharacterized protein
MLRVILLTLGIAALVWLLRRAFVSDADRGQRGERESEDDAADELVRCAHCGVHVPRIDAQTQDGRHFCSREHARLGAGEARS